MPLKNFIQDKLGELAEDFTGNLKFVLRGKIIVDLKKMEIKTEGMYLAVVDKNTGEDIYKKHLPFLASIDIDTYYSIPIEIKGDFK